MADNITVPVGQPNVRDWAKFDAIWDLQEGENTESRLTSWSITTIPCMGQYQRAQQRRAQSCETEILTTANTPSPCSSSENIPKPIPPIRHDQAEAHTTGQHKQRPAH
ncbi:Hypothetical predicted protein [Pelobates cultripes]|uniref:Uncharacterized protein n=1 Tax=Pelobates cultripes TaxID=61616 RepID=A0AAD1S168_PELCU|nr:Hypothetical predicted protein [Pelobates cultripes]